MQKGGMHRGGVPLRKLKKGDAGIIACLSPKKVSDLHQLLILGLVPGEKVEVIHDRPLHVVRVGHTHIALDRERAAEILVLPE